MVPMPTDRTCGAAECARPAVTAGYCTMHYARLRRYGNLTGMQPRDTAVNRVLRRVDKPDGEYGCWVCDLGLLPAGYSTVGVWDPEAKRAWPRRSHRVVYEHYRGPIPEGLVLDHLCSVRNCVNPAHLEAVTQAENTRRGDTPAARTRRTGYCQRGHEMTADNVLVHHTCRACEQAGRRRRRQAGRADTAALSAA